MNLRNALTANKQKQVFTENGALAHKSSGSKVLNFFAQGGSLRNRSEKEILDLFYEAWEEDSLLALKSLFYFRDIRQGQGERRLFRVILRDLALNYPDVINNNIDFIPYYGRWDDLFVLLHTKPRVEVEVLDLIDYQLLKDLESERPSLLAKWMPSENASNKDTIKLAKYIRNNLNISSKTYRQMLSSLRKKINIVESQMSNKKWSEIDYSKVPSQASLKYRKAFLRNDRTRYMMYLEDLAKGKEKINTKTLYPYQIVGKYFNRLYSKDETLELMWQNLPNYIQNDENILCVVDTSGSMTCGFFNNVKPIDIAVSLGIYTAERNKGQFHNMFLTFSSDPEIVELQGNNLFEKVCNMEKSNWGRNTNIEAIFDLILESAIDNNVPQNEMPSRIIIISDMEFDQALMNKKPPFKVIEQKYNDNNYTLPKLVFWNVNAKNNQFPATMFDNVQLISGASPNIFTALLENRDLDPYALMLEILNSERYSLINL